jgi:flagellar motor switch protein FliG
METATALLQCSSMTKLQKLAALLVILGADSASELLKNLDEQELEAVSAEMARLTFISQELQQEILREFTDVAVAASAAILGGPGYAKKALERSVGPSRASDIIRRVAPAAAPSPPWSRSWKWTRASFSICSSRNSRRPLPSWPPICPRKKAPGSSPSCRPPSATKWWNGWP